MSTDQGRSSINIERRIQSRVVMLSLLCFKPLSCVNHLCMDDWADKEDFGSSSVKKSDAQDALVTAQDSIPKHSRRKRSFKSKKKTPWYSALYPTYKSRSEDFRRIFKDISPEERLVVDYSCAIQRDILIHGRLYASQHFLCFYANIFRWETQVIINWKDITSITKEKTALVIPNAILVQTESEKHFFASFATRDKTHLMLFRIWQHALTQQPMSVQELWHWVHVCYGEELGLTSDDEDYVPPCLDESNLSSKMASQEFSEESTQGFRKGLEGKEMPPELSQNVIPQDQIPTDTSDTTESDEDKNQSLPEFRRSVGPVSCPIPHEGKLMLSEVYPITVDEFFTLLFTRNKFIMEVFEAMKYSDVECGEWEENQSSKMKVRVNHLVAPVSQSVGPKTCLVTETQVMKAHKPGELYVVEVESVNAGVPYSDSFYITSHLCMSRVSVSQTTLCVYIQIKYRKSVWAIVKNFIEKNVWAGLEDFYKCLARSLEDECVRRQGLVGGGEMLRVAKQESIKVSTSVPSATHVPVPHLSLSTNPVPPTHNERAIWCVLGALTFLLLLNAFLYYKLFAMENLDSEPRIESILDARLFGEERSHEQWLSLLRKQAAQHHTQVQQWKITLKSVVSLLKKAEESMLGLQNDIQSAVNDKVMSALNPHLEPDDASLNTEHNEL